MDCDRLIPHRFAGVDAGDARHATREALMLLFGPPAERAFTVRFWDGSAEYPDRRSRFTLILRCPSALRRMLVPPTERRLGEAYVRGDVDIEGDVEAAAAALTATVAERVRHPRVLVHLLRYVIRLRGERALIDPRRVWHAYTRSGLRHSRERDAAAIQHHYDLGNAFYGLWLDRRMVYSCAYFPTGQEDLDTAQEAKLDLICRKLRLQAGERLLDIGCGWGALVLHAAQRYGVDATGITISREQASFARERIAAAGLANRCRVELCDYRDLAGARFDKIASVGMVEHVGHAKLSEYFQHAFRVLEPGGLFLNHGIISLAVPAPAVRRWLSQRIHRWTSFIDAYVFPDGELVAPEDLVGAATRAGFELRDVESLREHYVRTLRHWVRGLERRRDEAVAAAGEPTYRVWRAYMAGSAHAFASGRIGVIQALFARRDPGGAVALPATRADVYL